MLNKTESFFLILWLFLEVPGIVGCISLRPKRRPSVCSSVVVLQSRGSSFLWKFCAENSEHLRRIWDRTRKPRALQLQRYLYIWYDMIWYDLIWYDMIWFDMIWYDIIWYDMSVNIWVNVYVYIYMYIYIYIIYIYLYIYIYIFIRLLEQFLFAATVMKLKPGSIRHMEWSCQHVKIILNWQPEHW